MTKWPNYMPDDYAGKDTLFVSKIWLSMDLIDVEIGKDIVFNCPINDNINCLPKIHTIRSLTKKGVARWRAGLDIHFKIWTGKPYCSKTFNFVPIIKCISVQSFEVKVGDNEGGVNGLSFFIDGKYAYYSQIMELAINDGFEDIDGFMAYFNKPFKGQIIHWTNFKY